MNNVVLVGNLCKDVVAVNVGETIKCDNTLAVLRGKEVTDFIPIRVWGTQANFMQQFLRKGAKVAVTGSIRVDSWDAPDGTKRSMTYVNVTNLENLTPKEQMTNQPMQPQPQAYSTSQQETPPTNFSVNDEDLPF